MCYIGSNTPNKRKLIVFNNSIIILSFHLKNKVISIQNLIKQPCSFRELSVMTSKVTQPVYEKPLVIVFVVKKPIQHIYALDKYLV